MFSVQCGLLDLQRQPVWYLVYRFSVKICLSCVIIFFCNIQRTSSEKYFSHCSKSVEILHHVTLLPPIPAVTFPPHPLLVDPQITTHRHMIHRDTSGLERDYEQVPHRLADMGCHNPMFNRIVYKNILRYLLKYLELLFP